jgi:four helix bundle protein
LAIGQEQEMQDFRQLDVWKEAHELTLAVYKASASFPTSEIYGLTSQVKGAAYSIPSNIAEGCGRDTALDLARFLQIAQGSASELDYHLLLARDLGFLGLPPPVDMAHPNPKDAHILDVPSTAGHASTHT